MACAAEHVHSRCCTPNQQGFHSATLTTSGNMLTVQLWPLGSLQADSSVVVASVSALQGHELTTTSATQTTSVKSDCRCASGASVSPAV